MCVLLFQKNKTLIIKLLIKSNDEKAGKMCYFLTDRKKVVN